MHRKKVLIIGPQPEPITGVSLANKVVSEILTEKGYCVTKLNTSFIAFDENLGAFSIRKVLFNLKYNLKSYKVFQNDIIYITPGQTFFGIIKYSVIIIFGSLSRKRMIIHIHGNHLRTAFDNLNSLKKWLIKSLLSKFDIGIVLSTSLVDNLSPFLDKKDIKILPNFAEDYLSRNITKDYRHPRFIYLSNLMEEKGILHLLKALKRLEKENISYSAKIAGDVTKEMWAKIKPLLDNLHSVTFLGVIKGAEKKALLEWGNVFVLPTYYEMEGQPISILEAMATGNLIITTQHGGIPDIIKPNVNGFFIKKNSELELFEKLKEIATNPQIISDIGKANVSYFNAQFTMDHFKTKLLKIFTSK